MKLKLALALSLVVALLVPVGYAHADGADPVVVVNRSGDPSCTAPNVVCFDQTNSAANPVIETLVNGLFTQIELEYDGATPLTTFYIAFAGALPFEQLTCTSDIFASCGFVNTVGTDLSNDDEFFFTMGSIEPNTGITIQVISTPETREGLLLLLGILPLFSVKEWRALATRA